MFLIMLSPVHKFAEITYCVLSQGGIPPTGSADFCHRLCEGHAVLYNLFCYIVLINGVVSFPFDELLCSRGRMSLAEPVTFFSYQGADVFRISQLLNLIDHIEQCFQFLQHGVLLPE